MKKTGKKEPESTTIASCEDSTCLLTYAHRAHVGRCVACDKRPFYVNDAVYVTVDNHDRNTEHEITIPGKIVAINGDILRVWLEEGLHEPFDNEVTLNFMHIEGKFYNALHNNQRVMITHL